jgi:hypothetical protein
MNHRVTFVPFILLFSSMGLCAQAPSAPIPAQLTTAKTVFLANAGSTPTNSQLAIVTYNNVYQGLAAQNRYQLTSAPADADLIFEVSVISIFQGQSASNAQYIQLVIRDAKSQSLLWTISEDIGVAYTEKTGQKNADAAAAKLVADVGSLTSATVATPPPATAPTKTRLSDEGKK